MILDFKIGDIGDLEYNNNTKDIYYVDEDSIIKQIATNRIKSVVGDWFNTTIGANLEEFLGRPNTENTSTDVINKITQSLTYDDFLKESDLYFIPKINKSILEIKLFIKKKFDNGPIIIDVVIDLTSGVKISSDINN